MNLVSRNFPSGKKELPQDSSDLKSQGNHELDQSCVSSSGSNVFSREGQQDDTQSSSTRKLRRRDELSSSARARKLERGEDIQIGMSMMKFHNVQISTIDF